MHGNQSVTVTSPGALVKSGPGHGVYAATLASTSGAAHATLDDSIVASGTPLWHITIPAGETASVFFGERPILFGSGIYASVSGTGATFCVQCA